MKKTLALLLSICCICVSACLFTACDFGGGNEQDTQISSIYNLYVAYAESNGETPLSYEDWLASIKGEDGADGKDGATPTIEISEDGYWVINGVKTEYQAIGKDGADGKDGSNGKDGTDGATPTVEISEDGYWVINGVKTEHQAIGKDGGESSDGKDSADGVTPTIEISEDGYWVINGVKTEYQAIGKDGADGTDGANGKDGTNGKDGKDGTDGADGKDGATPTVEISEDGYWVINGVKTEYQAIGKDGANGTDGTDGKNGANGKDGTNGKDGKDGTNGTDGKDGATIEKVEFDSQGRLVITLTDGTVLDPIEMPDLHTYGEWQAFGEDQNTCENKMFYRVCSDCLDVQLKHGTESDHKWSTETISSTCQSQGYDQKTCSICGKEEKLNYQPLSDHQWQTAYTTDNSFHWIKCNDCKEFKEKQEHTPDDSGYCTVCDGVAGATVGILYDLSSDGTHAEVIGYEGSATKIIIASEYQGKPVKTICSRAFYNNDKITSVYIPNSVTSIGDNAFQDCSKLTNVVIADGVTSIGHAAFEFCHNLTNIVIPSSVISIDSNAFPTYDNSPLCTTENGLTYVKANGNIYYILMEVENRNLTTYNINPETKHIAGSGFSSCSRLKSISIPNGVTSIGTNAFNGCSSLTSIEIPDSVTSISSAAFQDCTSLTSVVIPDSVTSIGYRAFFGCTNLTNIEIPDSVISIGDYAFDDCSSLTNVTIGNGIITIGKWAFGSSFKLTTVYYGGTEAEWDVLSNAIGSGNTELTNATRYYYSKEKPTTAGNYWHYDENGNIVIWGE